MSESQSSGEGGLEAELQREEPAGTYASEAKGAAWVCRLLGCLGHTVCKCRVEGEGPACGS